MVQRLLHFLDASPVNFLAARNIASELEQAGYRRFDPRETLGEVKAGEAEVGFKMICAHCDSPTFRIKPNAEMLCRLPFLPKYAARPEFPASVSSIILTWLEAAH